MRTMRAALPCVLALCGAFASSAVAGSLPVERSDEVTSQDVPLTFELQKIEWNVVNNYVQLWGRISNSTHRKYEWVHITFTLYDAQGKLLEREGTYVDGLDLPPGKLSYIDVRIYSKGGRPARIEYKIQAD